jgi:hypothetical protein
MLQDMPKDPVIYDLEIHPSSQSVSPGCEKQTYTMKEACLDLFQKGY